MSPPVSLVLATWSRSYIEGLVGTRYAGPSNSDAAHDGLNRWIAFFAGACRRAVEDALDFEQKVDDIERAWRATLGRVRAGSAVELLLKVLPGAPILSVGGAAELIGRSFQATNEAVRRLETAGIVAQVTVGRRNRAYEAQAIIDAFAVLERQLASPVGDTRAAPPRRPTPARPERPWPS